MERKIESIVIGNSENFKLALGKYAFLSCGYIPKEYLESLLQSGISDSDKEVISNYIKKQS